MLSFGALSLIFINHWRLLHFILMTLFVAQVVLSHKIKDRMSYPKLFGSLGMIFVLSEVIFLVHYNYSLFCFNAFGSIILGWFWIVAYAISHYKFQLVNADAKSLKHIVVIEATAITLFGMGLAFIIFFLMAIAVKPSVGIDLLVKNANSYEPIQHPSTKEIDGGTIYWNDIQYGIAYPRSFLDIYVSNENNSSPKPTFIYIHGGGFIQGDKAMGDPYAGNMGSDYYLPFIDRGYNVVAINYAFAPEYQYPTPVLQMSEAVEFLKSNADKYGLNMNEVFIGGNSAGGHIAGQFALIQSSNEYASEVNIEPVLSKNSLKAVILNSALLEPSEFDVSGDWTFDYQLSVVARAYWGCDFKTNQYTRKASIIQHVKKDYPPVYITDGNTGSFYKQAKLFAEKLEEAGMIYELSFYEKEEAVLTHSYETALDTPQAIENMEKMFDFMENQLNR